MDFFEQTNEFVSRLNENERKLFEYVVHNIHAVKDMNIRAIASNCYVSTTTVIRFVKKLGFSGYRAFTDSIRLTCHALRQNEVPDVLWKQTYSEEYLKNIIESVRVVTQEKIQRFTGYVRRHAPIYFLGSGLNREAARYAYHLFTALGYYTYLPVEDYEVASTLAQIKDGDIIFAFSFDGEDTAIIELIEKANLKCKPIVVSITWSGNNIIQNLSDLDFYVFADHVRCNGVDLTSRVSMIAIAEMLAYALVAPSDVTQYTQL